MKIASIALATALSAMCTPTPEPPARLDASAASCSDACITLAILGCHEGEVQNCVSTCEHAQASRITDLHTGCLAAAKTKAEARACKSVRCE